MDTFTTLGAVARVNLCRPESCTARTTRARDNNVDTPGGGTLARCPWFGRAGGRQFRAKAQPSARVCGPRVVLLPSRTQSLHAAAGAMASSPSSARAAVALVVGAGRGIGGHVAARFAREGMTACLVRRSDEHHLDESVASIRAAGGRARGFLCDATDAGSVTSLVDEIERDVGPVECCVYNLGANMGVRGLEDTSPRIFDRALKLGAVGAFLVSSAVLPRMQARGRGSFLVTGASASLRGNYGHLAHAAGMHARRGLVQSLAHEFWPKGIHVAHVVVDGLVDAPDTVGKFFPEMFEAAKKKAEADQNIVKPADVADMYWHLHAQPRGCWTFEADVRPWLDTAWFNTGDVSRL